MYPTGKDFQNQLGDLQMRHLITREDWPVQPGMHLESCAESFPNFVPEGLRHQRCWRSTIYRESYRSWIEPLPEYAVTARVEPPRV